MVVFPGKNFIKAFLAILIDGESGDEMQRDNRNRPNGAGIRDFVFTYSRRIVLFLIALQPGFVNDSAIGHHAPDDNTLIK